MGVEDPRTQACRLRYQVVAIAARPGSKVLDCCLEPPCRYVQSPEDTVIGYGIRLHDHAHDVPAGGRDARNPDSIPERPKGGSMLTV
jgi:hypothetical protein